MKCCKKEHRVPFNTCTSDPRDQAVLNGLWKLSEILPRCHFGYFLDHPTSPHLLVEHNKHFSFHLVKKKQGVWWRERGMLLVLQQSKSRKSADENAPNLNRALGRINRLDLRAIKNSRLNKRLISKTQRYLKASISKEDRSWWELKHSSCSVHLTEHFKSPKIEL